MLVWKLAGFGLWLRRFLIIIFITYTFIQPRRYNNLIIVQQSTTLTTRLFNNSIVVQPSTTLMNEDICMFNQVSTTIP
jgi:hypothetical protein